MKPFFSSTRADAGFRARQAEIMLSKSQFLEGEGECKTHRLGCNALAPMRRRDRVVTLGRACISIDTTNLNEAYNISAGENREWKTLALPAQL